MTTIPEPSKKEMEITIAEISVEPILVQDKVIAHLIRIGALLADLSELAEDFMELSPDQHDAIDLFRKMREVLR